MRVVKAGVFIHNMYMMPHGGEEAKIELPLQKQMRCKIQKQKKPSTFEKKRIILKNHK